MAPSSAVIWIPMLETFLVPFNRNVLFIARNLVIKHRDTAILTYWAKDISSTLVSYIAAAGNL